MADKQKISEMTVPFSDEAEQAVLGAMILNPEVVDQIDALLRPEQFHRERHSEVYNAILFLHKGGRRADFTTLADELRRQGLLDKIGGPGYLALLEKSVFDPQEAEHHAQIVIEKHRLREIIRFGNEVQQQAAEQRASAHELIDVALERLFKLGEERAGKEFYEVGALSHHTIEMVEERMGAEGGITGLATGFPRYDDATGGLQKQDLVILAARPSVGKTAFALNLALNIGSGKLNTGRFRPELARSVAFFSLEMAALQINQRLLSTVANVSMLKMRSGHVSHAEVTKLAEAAKNLADVPIYIDDTAGLSVAELRAKAKRLEAKCRARPDGKELSLIVVDYLQLMRGSQRTENRQQEIAEISRSLKALAKDLKHSGDCVEPAQPPDRAPHGRAGQAATE